MRLMQRWFYQLRDFISLRRLFIKARYCQIWLFRQLRRSESMGRLGWMQVFGELVLVRLSIWVCKLVILLLRCVTSDLKLIIVSSFDFNSILSLGQSLHIADCTEVTGVDDITLTVDLDKVFYLLLYILSYLVCSYLFTL